jgi:dTDP-glucose 4,6-dehydratase
MMSKKIVYVTGCLGFIGYHVAKACLENGWYVRGIDSGTYAANWNLLDDLCKYKNFTFEETDINDLNILYECDYFINTAAETHVDNSISSSDVFLHSNIDGVHHILELIKNKSRLKMPVLLHFSTDEVYGDMDDHIAINHVAQEGDNLSPSSYYSATKAASDMLVLSANRTYGLPYLITRTCNNFGEHQFEEKFLPTIARSIQEGKPIPVYGDGKQVREWMYVHDNVKVICDFMFDDTIINQIMNIGTGFRVTNLDIINKIASILNKEVQIKHVEDRLGHDRKYGLFSKKMMSFYQNKEETIDFKNLYDYLEEQYGK